MARRRRGPNDDDGTERRCKLAHSRNAKDGRRFKKKRTLDGCPLQNRNVIKSTHALTLNTAVK